RAVLHRPMIVVAGRNRTQCTFWMMHCCRTGGQAVAWAFPDSKELDMLKWSLVCLLLFAPLAHAAPPSDQQVRQLLQASQVRAGLDSYMAAFEQNSLAQLQRSMPELMADAQSRREMQAMVAQTAQQVRQHLDWQVLEPRYIHIYQQVM